MFGEVTKKSSLKNNWRIITIVSYDIGLIVKEVEGIVNYKLE